MLGPKGRDKDGVICVKENLAFIFCYLLLVSIALRDSTKVVSLFLKLEFTEVPNT